ncbi:MAG: anti-sigma factor [Verrucomicrobia bacterium]|nr:anti-sigma factor [Verrucomicrobiota bacterium]
MAPMEGLGEYSSLAGNFIWSDSRQEGYLQLSGLPVNDPAQKQYQLWIVDPSRDEAPVDGGVFDIRSPGMNIIPIDAKLQVSRPKAFVITLEQPGGVVKSRQEIVVGIGSSPI